MSFFCALTGDQVGYDPRQCVNKYTGKNGKINHWLIKCSIDSNTLKLVCKDYKTQSMLFLSNTVKSVHEFAQNKLIIYNDPSILICHDWEVIHTIDEVIPGNKDKFWISKMPFFDLQTLPFVVISGKEVFSLINVQTGKIFPLILGSAFNTRAQSSAFFIEQESESFDMNFCTLVANQ